MTGDEAREYFQVKGLTYGDISVYSVDLLNTYIQAEIMQERENDPECILCRTNTPKYSRKKNADGGFQWVEITVQGTYFSDREAISFNRDGFIGFSGWASSKNTRPFIAAFVKWCDKIAEKKEIHDNGQD